MIRTIQINPVLNGYIVNVGCQQLVMGSKEALLNNLKDYLDNPRRVEAEFLKNAVNPMKEEVPCEAPRRTHPNEIANLQSFAQGCDTGVPSARPC